MIYACITLILLIVIIMINYNLIIIILTAQRGYVPLINATVTIHPSKVTAGVLATILDGVGWEAFTAHLSLVSPLSDRITVAPAVAAVHIIH